MIDNFYGDAIICHINPGSRVFVLASSSCKAFCDYKHNTWLIISIIIAILLLSSPLTANGISETTFTFGESPTVEEYVRIYFRDIPVMTKVAECESRFRQFNKYGDILRGEENFQDVGVMQVNERYHLETADKLGHNLYTLDGNLAYARYLYKKEGTTPWQSSAICWDDAYHFALR